ncbi:hypothetical protein LNV23_10065 [Paucibacter sp. DJ1R-11]|uniref:hypothetical protein n=1 Tax=Paucibacter sp. DJ1R-11 TaxID=2893556 RepID=UPI0021E4431F|nr:hypothetical protein [Paucibacter sp. DJ1R-11]MCV2363795.1 hypothetical protein [Paucibacter sp. DJ1R-11]
MPGPAIIEIHPEAPPKPARGLPCNGCGLCCLSEPCPIGVLVSRKRQGRCNALRWSAEERRYVCGMLSTPWRHLGATRPWANDAARRRNRLLARLCRRWIAAGVGCDADLEAEAAPTSGQATTNESEQQG